MHKLILILMAGILFCTAGQAQEKKDVYTDSSLITTEDGTEVYDSVAVSAPVEESSQFNPPQAVIEIDTTLYFNSLTVSKDSVAYWKNMQGFAYVQYLDSLLKAKKAEDNKRVQAKSSTVSELPSGVSWLDRFFASKGLQIFLWVLAGSFVLFVLYKLFLTEGVFRKTVKNKTASTPDVEEEVIDRETNFDALIRNAVQAANYRLAVRYHYLQTLHLLAGRNQITLAVDKTNYQYVQEVQNSHFRNEFAALTLNYEYVWYGEFLIDEAVYAKLKAAYGAFNQQL